jgi:hypothetical protein
VPDFLHEEAAFWFLVERGWVRVPDRDTMSLMDVVRASRFLDAVVAAEREQFEREKAKR